jgi:serine/threonine protein kinase
MIFWKKLALQIQRVCTNGKNWIQISSLCKSSGKLVSVKVLTVFEMDDMKDIMNELMKKINKTGEFEAQLYDVFCYNGNMFLVLEYFENGSIKDLVTIIRLIY